ncbi:hypothetical protein ABVB72_19730 [Rhizobium nepotum]|uniref:hypothetical protein n=1 Tax=Rhizobium nepotum TaxID=1035271 RepID=UPI00336AB15C
MSITSVTSLIWSVLVSGLSTTHRARNCMQPEKPSKRQLRSKSGVAELDEMFGGGQEAGTTTLVLIS